MSEVTQTARVQDWIVRLQNGDSAARDELLNYSCNRLLRLTRKILRGSPRIRRWEETDDVFQNSVLRLCRALEQVAPTDAHSFFRLAAQHIRWELCDLARKHFGPQGDAAHYATQAKSSGVSSADPGPFDPGSESQSPQELAEWTEFHSRIDELPENERGVVDLLWYHNLTQAEAAELLGVEVRTVKRRWQSARLKLYEMLGGAPPGV